MDLMRKTVAIVPRVVAYLLITDTYKGARSQAGVLFEVLSNCELTPIDANSFPGSARDSPARFGYEPKRT
jgi:hypothetical protein